MQRRTLLSAAALGALAALPLPALTEPEFTDYTPEAYRAALAAGGPLLLDFYASW